MRQKPKVIDIAFIKREIRRMDPQLKDENDETFKAAVVLMSATQTSGNSIRALQKFTGYTRPFVARIVAGAQKNGIFRGDGKIACEWFDKDGGIAFWMDVCCVLGLMERTRAVGATESA